MHVYNKQLRRRASARTTKPPVPSPANNLCPHSLRPPSSDPTSTVAQGVDENKIDIWEIPNHSITLNKRKNSCVPIKAGSTMRTPHIERAKSYVTSNHDSYKLANAAQLQVEFWHKQRKFAKVKREAFLALDGLEKLGVAMDVKEVRRLLWQIDRDRRNKRSRFHCLLLTLYPLCFPDTRAMQVFPGRIICNCLSNLLMYIIVNCRYPEQEGDSC